MKILEFIGIELEFILFILFRVVGLPQVTAVKFRDALTLGVGTSTGQVLLYDMRSNRPVRVKDHRYGLPIKKVDFHHMSHDLVASMDSRILRLWDRNSVNINSNLYTGIF